MGTGGECANRPHSATWEGVTFGEFKQTEVANTMMARDHKFPRFLVGVPIPYTLKIRGGCEGGVREL
jgi:hypothetical protein